MRVFNSAYFDVTPDAAARSGLPVYDARGGLQAVGVTAGYIKQFTPRWGVYSYAKYDRLAGDAADSPVVRALRVAQPSIGRRRADL